ncbi:DNA polymerase III, subunit gamma and tau [Rhodoluna lacicola]|uniref:DNA polymerase III subunit gamma/tau n=1 Tax=Rhodoluna lacicola TaxID=529884 RepID=A0A060JKN7_9MICO|nr:DNA polymerase III, subunit gamma and tau [Rhodoluna lacicola]
MVTALYRRYRPETFAELIGQAQVTAPLMTALRTDRVNHAYLFSGPRGCGKTTSARILARCLNCAEGPTDTPCGVCPSCVELSRDGSGSLDVVEIDAASHNGVDDARDLRERAIFAPARDRYKIFILDEAHMVTPQGFNALLKIVEEPPAHVKFIFATTEPDKVIGTIRSRTHHYPFRLVPPAQMLEYLEQLCSSEKVEVAPGVLSLVVRSGGGSVRDSLSLLDQLIAGSEGGKVEYDRAAALLGFTHAALLDEVVDAFAAKNSAQVFASVDKVIQTGQDPRRFVEDLLEHLRDLIVILSVGDEAKSVLRGIPADELEKMKTQALGFGLAELTHAAETVNAALTEMSGATSPKLHLELMCAKVLVPSSDQTEVGSLARIERLERRIGVGSGDAASPAASVATVQASTQNATPVTRIGSEKPAGVSAPKAEKITEVSAPAGIGGVTLTQFKDSWPNILTLVNKKSKAAWMVAFALSVVDFAGDVLTLKFMSQKDLDSFKNASGASEVLRGAIMDVLGVQVKFKAQIDAKPEDAPAPAAPAEPAPVKADTKPMAVVEEVEPQDQAPAQEVAAAPEPKSAPEQKSRNSGMADESARYGESLLREMLGAEPMQDKNGK